MEEVLIGEIRRGTREKSLFQLVFTRNLIMIVPLASAYAYTLVMIPFALLGGLLLSYLGTGIFGRGGIVLSGGLGGLAGGAIAYFILDALLLSKSSIKILHNAIRKIPENKNIENVPLKELKYINFKEKLLTFARGERLYSFTIDEKKDRITCELILQRLTKENLVAATGKQMSESFKQMLKELKGKKKKK